MSDNIYKAIAKYITDLFEQHANPNLLYHNLEHTKKVVQHAEEIGAHYKLSEEDTLTLYTAAWFHDVGHLFTEMDKHEEKSAEMMREFMHKEGISDAVIDNIADCIKATRFSADPHGLLQEIICDADTYHFGTNEFKDTNKLVKKEFELRGYNTLTQDWNSNSIELLKKHTYFTTYCKILLEEKKQKNIQWLERKIHNKNADNVHHDMFSGQNSQQNVKQSKNLLSRGLQTAMRVTSSNHLHLSEMADR
ncbi:MAG TPA: HD domain-containing protein, partial [Flavipsychrobacter sp.]|nr:HD domain-containing protein [Flavipsychrobacter sp.]